MKKPATGFETGKQREAPDALLIVSIGNCEANMLWRLSVSPPIRLSSGLPRSNALRADYSADARKVTAKISALSCEGRAVTMVLRCPGCALTSNLLVCACSMTA
jgi:hypothetical protein